MEGFFAFVGCILFGIGLGLVVTPMISSKNCGSVSESLPESSKRADINSWPIGGGVMMGLGVGFFFLAVSPLVFVACLLIGLGLGLVITSILSRIKGRD